MNLKFRGDWLRLDPLWNLTKPHPALRALDPFIVHYTTGMKPWNRLAYVAFGSSYKHVMTRDVLVRYPPLSVAPAPRQVVRPARLIAEPLSLPFRTPAQRLRVVRRRSAGFAAPGALIHAVPPYYIILVVDRERLAFPEPKMFEAISRFFSSGADAPMADNDPRLAVAVLLVHLAAVDGTVGDEEKRAVRGALQDYFGLDEATVRELVHEARRRDAEAVDSITSPRRWRRSRKSGASKSSG